MGFSELLDVIVVIVLTAPPVSAVKGTVVGTTLGRGTAVPLRSLRKEKALDLRPRTRATVCGSTVRARSLTSEAVSRNRSPNATNAYARSGWPPIS